MAGAAVIREREHGTMDHLLVMPTPFEIAMPKIWANGLIIAVAVGLSLSIVVRFARRVYPRQKPSPGQFPISLRPGAETEPPSPK